MCVSVIYVYLCNTSSRSQRGLLAYIYIHTHTRIYKFYGSDPSCPTHLLVSASSIFISDSPPATPELQNGIVAEDSTLEGLADAWESDQRVRRRTIKLKGHLIQWPNPKSMLYFTSWRFGAQSHRTEKTLMLILSKLRWGGLMKID